MKSRNLVSIGLVVLFFLVYILAGGTVSWAPSKVKPSDTTFGAAGTSGLGSRPNTFTGDVDRADPEPGVVAEPPSTPRESDEPEVDANYESDAMANIRERLKNLNRHDGAK